jgi:3-(methylthio)propanoyl-CoA dehydrogenase
MSEYIAPLREMRFVLTELAGLDEISSLPGFEDATPDTVEAVLEEAGKFAAGVLAPLNRVGDLQGARWENGHVYTPAGWRDAYDQFRDAGWTALAIPKEYGGQGLPQLVSAMVEEMWSGSNLAFALCPFLNRGAIAALEVAGSQQIKQRYLQKMVSGEWTGTMNLTEPQAGSDLASLRTRAVPRGDGTHGIQGQKIFISYGEHDLAENIVHLVLARTPDAPAGTKGISLFVVPKVLVDDEGTLGARNDVRCASIEHKMGIHGSPTAMLAFGDQGGAVGYLVGDENRGLEYMFVMMNEARFAVGLQGIGLAERAYQRALAYARERVQGSEVGRKDGARVAIIRHPDVRRMLMSMKCRIEAMRALAAVVAASMDRAHAHPDAATRLQNQAFVDLMMPVVKAWSTENGMDIASLGVQIHGGMGFVEETGAAQHLRDARITTIYEGTTGIQAGDLVGRKIARERGRTIQWVIAQMVEVGALLAKQDDANLRAIGGALGNGTAALSSAVQFVVETYEWDPKRVLLGAVPFLELFGIVAGGWQTGRSALAASRLLGQGDDDSAFLRTKILTARFYADHFLSRVSGLASTVALGSEAAIVMADDNF